jgi:sulfur relay protein TusB/DsrH
MTANSTRKGSCLHLVVRSSADALENCQSQFAAEDEIVFLDEGVTHLAHFLRQASGPGPAGSFFSSEDLDARGLLPAAQSADAATVRDPDIVELLQKHDFCLTWK